MVHPWAYWPKPLGVIAVTEARAIRNLPVRTRAPAVWPGNGLHGDGAVDGHPVHQPPLG
jgi:hypothetical protein